MSGPTEDHQEGWRHKWYASPPNASVLRTLTFWKNSSSGLPSRAVPGCTTSATRTSSSSSELLSPYQGGSHRHSLLAAVLAPQEPRASGIFLPGRQPPLPGSSAPAQRQPPLTPARPPHPGLSPASARGSCRAWWPERPVPGPEPRGPQRSKFGSPAPLSHLTPPPSPCEPQDPQEPPEAPPPSPSRVAGRNPTIGPLKFYRLEFPSLPPLLLPQRRPRPSGAMTPSMRARSRLSLAEGEGGGRKQWRQNGSEAAWVEGPPPSSPPSAPPLPEHLRLELKCSCPKGWECVIRTQSELLVAHITPWHPPVT